MTIGLSHGLLEIYARLSQQRRRHLYFVLALMLLGAIAELATIGAVVPFLALLARESTSHALPWPMNAFESLTSDAGRQGLTIATLVFAALAISAGIVRLGLAWSSQKFVFRLGHELAVEVHRRILWQPYSYHIGHNTSDVLSSLEKAGILALNVLMPLMQAAIAAVIAFFIIVALIYIDAFTAISTALAFLLIYLLVTAATRRRLAADSITLNSALNQRWRRVQEALGGIRDVIVDNSQALHLDAFQRVDNDLSVTRANTQFIGAAPRFLIEAAGMAVIAAIALFLADREGGLARALPVLGAIALGAQRLLPLLQQIYHGWSASAAHRAVMTDVIELLRLPIREELDVHALPPLAVRDRISFDNVSFVYANRQRPALQDISLEIPVGSTVGLVGETGSGKSTLVDVLMGLLEPSEGSIMIDGVPLTATNRTRWQRSIAHVPQSIFLADASIARNIALTLDEEAVDLPRVVTSAQRAQLDGFVASLPDGYTTVVGERGIRLSGGQRQRLGIARAVYKDAPVLILDEATSSLDEKTEAAVIDTLDGLRDAGRTIVIIAHRLSTISRCDIVVRLHEGRVVEVGSFAEVIGSAVHPS